MQIGSIKEGDLVEVNWKQGGHLVAMVAEGAHTEEATGRRIISLSDDPPRGITKPMRLTATAREVTEHWPKRGRRRKTQQRVE